VQESEEFSLTERFDAEVLSAFSEVFNNICIHSYTNGLAGGEVQIEVDVGEDFVELRLRDNGAPFELADVPPPDLDSMPEGGLGVFIIRSFVDEFEYQPGPPNVWILRKYRSISETGQRAASE
jgi:serine/threonine-protein kinase RsbW